MPTLTPDAVLLAAALYFEIDPDRWGRDYYRDPATGCRCALGGIAWVLSPSGEDDDPYWLPQDDDLRGTARAAIELLEQYLTDELGFQPADEIQPVVGQWNDAAGRTVHEVIGTLRAAAHWAAERAA